MKLRKFANVEFDASSVMINGERKFLISGEIPYFRVPKSDWADRLDAFIKAGGNCVATYVPWLIHEPDEGRIIFDDCDERALTDFMEVVKRKGLALILRPGPYVYSELINSGLPTWLVRNYPELHAKTVDGEDFREESCSYIHPMFIRFTKRWYSAFSKVAEPYLAKNGGPVVMIQLDNEVVGVHEWWGSIDYNPVAMGFGKEDGRYTLYLKNKYGDISALNSAYETNYESFIEVTPKTDVECGIGTARKVKDYFEFYCSTVVEYLVTLKKILIENGIDTVFCHNAYGPNAISQIKGVREALGKGFLLGVDNYYSLNISWQQNNPTPQYFTRVLFAVDQLKALGYPPAVLEMPGGSPSDVPPILKEDLYTCYMANLAAGMRAVNYYIFAGGKNVEGTGFMSDIYDYNTFISPSGEVRHTYQALKQFNSVLNENEWLCETERFASVGVGFEWRSLQCDRYAAKAGAFNTLRAQNVTDRCVIFSLLSGKYSGAYTPLEKELDVNKPLIICGTDDMSKAVQENVVEFLKNGGKLLLLTTFPKTDEEYNPCTVLRDAVGIFETAKNDTENYVTNICGMRVYRVLCENKLMSIPDGASVLATDEYGENILGFSKKVGKGEIKYLGGNWLTADFKQVEMLEKLLDSFGAKPCAEHSNRNVYITLYENGDNRGVFVINLYTGEQETDVTVYGNGAKKSLGAIKLSPMEIKLIRF